ncbi:ankyrin repeat-containing domain protein [Desarmillaria tabescens]|uniref:Ankyrin repeat-containing domain protein n=1 Tax=Armillaria tabescens TaxID=1929756 RepID=A0AA39J8S4_ARMTA|nr:ankyrin repeat-containing domain protein [Desarmillaria tabescens]KAK0438143.1 ankyrin repeat-containing domain protein [Desarmillaria tabescens]
MFVTKRLSRGDLANLIGKDDALRKEICTGVTTKADGMFLLAKLHVDLLAQTISRGRLREELGKLPKTINGMFDKALTERVNKQGDDKKNLAHAIRDVHRIRSMVVTYGVYGYGYPSSSSKCPYTDNAFARRPLTVLELWHALALQWGTEPFEPDNLCDINILGNVCAGLVVMDGTYRSSGPFQKLKMNLLDYTVQEYFISQQDRLFPDIQKQITLTCLMYMRNPALHIFQPLPPKPNSRANSGANCIHCHRFRGIHDQKLIEEYPFLAYSPVFWVYHAHGAVERLLEDEIIAFLSVARHRQVANTFRKATSNPGPDYTALHSAVHYGLVHIMKVLLDRRRPDPHEPEAVKLLLSRGDVDFNQADPETGRTPLMEAAREGHEEMVKAILDFRESALFRTIYDAHQGVFGTLPATTGINAALNNKGADSPLPIAMHYTRSDTPLGRVDPDAQSPLTQWTPLFYAAESGHPNIIEMLLQTGQVDVNRRDHEGHTALMVAAYYGRTSAVKALLASARIDIMAKDDSGMTAYYHAGRGRWSGGDHETVVVLLEEKGAVVKDGDYQPTYLTTAYLPNGQL